MTHASRDTTTGLTFEKMAQIHRADGIDISKKKLKKFLQERGLSDPTQYLSWMFEPDEAYYIPETNEVVIYEKKFQKKNGSADEKLGNCAWKIKEYKDCFSAVNIPTVSYIYLLCDWFSSPRYSKLLSYIRSVEGCDYQIVEVS